MKRIFPLLILACIGVGCMAAVYAIGMKYVADRLVAVKESMPDDMPAVMIEHEDGFVSFIACNDGRQTTLINCDHTKMALFQYHKDNVKPQTYILE